MILGENPGRYRAYDRLAYLLFEVEQPLGEVTVVPPPPGSSYQFASYGVAIARMGYRARVLNMSTCRRSTMEAVMAHATGELVYVGYAHRLAYGGPGALVDGREFSPQDVEAVARGNVTYRVNWRGCLAGYRPTADVVDLGRTPEALRRLEVWLAERFGGR